MTTLTDRYVAAAMRSVPERQRPDLAAELRASIDDEVDARVAAGEPAGDAERAVLTALGDPDALAAGYVDRPLHLIGPRYYLMWWRLTKLLWAIVPACAGFAVALGQVLSGAEPGGIIGSVVSVVLAVVVHIGFWTTLTFAIVERAPGAGEQNLPGTWTPDRLPEPREPGATLSDTVAAVVLTVALAGAVLWDHFFGFVYIAGEGWRAFLAPGLWPWWAGAFFAVLAVGAVLAVWVYIRGRWSIGAAVCNLVLDAMVVGGILWLLGQQQLVDPGLFPRLIPEGGDAVAAIVAIVFAFATVGVAVWDAIDGFRKARRSRSAGSVAPL